jgi:hypothetical protein
MDKRDQAYAAAFDEPPVEVRYGAANKRLYAKISQFPGAIEKRVLIEALIMPPKYAFASYFHHEHFLG